MEKVTVIVLDTLIGGVEICREVRDAGYKVIVVGQKSNSVNPALYIKGVKGFLLSSPQKEPEVLLTEIIEIGNKYPGIKVLIPANETYSIWMAQYRSLMPKEIHCLIPTLHLLKTIDDKWQQSILIKSIGVNVPKSALFSESRLVGDKFDFPAIVKPRFASTTVDFRDIFGRKVITVYNMKELESVCLLLEKKGFEPIIQENVPGLDEDQYFYGAVAKDGQPFSICIAQKLKVRPSPNGSGMIIRTIVEPTILDLGNKILNFINYSGICDIEFKQNQDTGEFQLIEFNPRYGMGQGVMRLAGITSPAMNINIVTNQLPVKVVVGAPGYYWIYLDEWIKERIIPWRNRKIRLLRNNHNTCQNIFFNDFKPELLHVANLFRIKAKRMISKQ